MKIDFYVLETASGQKSLLFACQLLEKAYAEQKPVYVHMNSREEAERLDALLWTYRDDSFVPHNLYAKEEEFPPLVQIGWDELVTLKPSLGHCERSEAIQDKAGLLRFARNDQDMLSNDESMMRNNSVLLNLAKDVPSFYQQFQEIIEIVFADPVVQQLARTRYKQYRDQGFDINTIKLKASEIKS